MIASEGILTCRGGVSSHAALVARQMGKVCVAGAGDIHIDYHAGTLTCKGVTLREGDSISINGSTGEVFNGLIKTADSELKQVLVGKTLEPGESATFKYYNSLMKLADKYRKLGIRTNADQPDQVENAIAFGAEGIGLCRTEHMFFEGDRIIAVRQMILADDLEGRQKALAKLLPLQQGDFEGIFRALAGRPACIRLLDPPLHEFLPQHDNPKGQQEVAQQLGISVETGEQARSRAARIQPDARLPRLPLGHQVPRNHRDASPGDFPSRRGGAGRRRESAAGSDGAAGGLQARAGFASGNHPPRGPRSDEGNRQEVQVQRGHDDRSAARRADRRRNRRTRPSSSASAPTI